MSCGGEGDLNDVLYTVKALGMVVSPGGFAGVHARTAIGGFDGRFSIEPELIVAIPAALAQAIIRNRGWRFPLPPAMLDKVRAMR